MRRLRALLAALTVTAVVLGTMGTAFAAGTTYSDVAKDSKLAEPVARLSVLNVIQGYPDGTFGPDRQVTRAEFAAIATRLLGYESASAPAQGPTPFADVPAAHWASGYINLANGQGLLKGYPDGTFRPDAPVTHAEALAILVRALGYEPAVRGAWPNNYLAKAAELGISDGVSVGASTPATRGDVAIFADNSLDVNLMEQTQFGTDTRFEETGRTLLSKYLDVDVFDQDWADDTDKTLPVVSKTPLSNIGDLKPDEIQFSGDGPSNTKKYKVASWLNPNDWSGQAVQVWIDKNDQVIYLAPSEDERVIRDEISAVKVDGDQVSIELDKTDDEFDIANSGVRGILVNLGQNGMRWTGDTAESEFATDLDNNDPTPASLKGATIKVVLNDKDEIIWASILTYTGNAPWNDVASGQPVLVKSVDAEDETITYYDESGGESDLDIQDDDYIVVRDGAPATLADIKPWDVLHYIQQDRDQHYLNAVSRKVSGTVTRVRTDNPSTLSGWDVYIDGTAYDVDSSATISTDNNETIEALTTSDFDDLVNEKVEVYLDARGDIRHIVTGAEVGAKQVGVISESPNYDDIADEWIITLVNEKGEEITYRTDASDVDVYDENGTLLSDSDSNSDSDSVPQNIQALFIADGGTYDTINPETKLVAFEYKLKGNGDLREIRLLDTQVDNDVDDGDTDESGDTISLNGDDYNVTSRTLFFDVTGGVNPENNSRLGQIPLNRYSIDDVDTTTWDAVANKDNLRVVYTTDGENVEYVFVVASGSGRLTSEGRYAVVDGFTTVEGDDAIDLVNADGKLQTYVRNESDPVGRKDFVRYELNSAGETDTITRLAVFDKVTDTYNAIRRAAGNVDPGTGISALAGLNIDTIALVKVDSATSRSIKTDGGRYFTVGSNTVYFDLDSRKVVGGVGRDDVVVLVDTDDDGATIDYVAIVQDNSDETVTDAIWRR